MQAESFDRRIYFRRATVTSGGFGQVETWSDHGDPVWAHKQDISDGERWRAGEVAAHITTRFVVRWSPFTAAIGPTDRVVSEGREMDIVGIKESGGRQRFIEITAAARAE